MHRLSKRGAVAAEGIVLYALALLRILYYGFRYFPQLDDYIQLYNYPAGESLAGRWGILMEQGLLASRPLAFFNDMMLWSAFWGCLIAAVLLITLLYVLSAMLLRRIFERYFSCGWIFYAIYLLLPLNMEGTYWLAASTRIVCGLFWSALSALLLLRWCDTGKRFCAVLTLLTQLIAFCHYEQALVFSFTLNLLLAFLELRRTRSRRTLLALGGLGCAALYFGVTALFAGHSVYASRMELALPVNAYYFDAFLPELLEQLRSVFVGGASHTAWWGFKRGWGILTGDGAWGYLLLLTLLAVCAGALSLAQPSDENPSPLWKQLLFALLLGAAPVSIFFVIANPWFSLRGAVFALPGIALGIDGLTNRLLSLLPRSAARTASLTLSALLCFGFVCASVAELHDYRQTTLDDQRVCAAIAAVCPQKTPALLFNLEPTYLSVQSYPWHEHIHGVTESPWALQGALNCLYGGGKSAYRVSPLPLRDTLYKAWNYDAMRLDAFERFYYYDPERNVLEEVFVLERDEGCYDVLNAEGVRLFGVREEEQCGYFVP